MSTPRRGGGRRAALLRRLALAGRDLSDAAVMFHTALAERLGLGPSDWKALGLIERFGPLTAGELAERSGLAPASVTGMIDRLERRGWVRRRRDADDGRRVVVALDAAAARRNTAALFGGLMRRLDKLYARYTDTQLAFAVELLTEIAGRQRDATADLTAGRRTPPSRG